MNKGINNPGFRALPQSVQQNILSNMKYGGRMYNTGGMLTEYNEGGTHEENPLGGIPVGQGPNGQPNLVEEGETRFGDYIFSDRLEITKDIAQEFNLPKNYVGKTFSDASKSMQKSNSRRVDDKIEQANIERNLTKLQEAQEMFKQAEVSKKLEEINELDPNALAAIAGQGQGQPSMAPTQPSPEEMMMMEQAAMQQGQMAGQPMMEGSMKGMAYGGPLSNIAFGGGGSMNFKSPAAYKAWLGYGHASGAFDRTPGNQKVSIKGEPHKVQHAMGGNMYPNGGYAGDPPPFFGTYGGFDDTPIPPLSPINEFEGPVNTAGPTNLTTNFIPVAQRDKADYLNNQLNLNNQNQGFLPYQTQRQITALSPEYTDYIREKEIQADLNKMQSNMRAMGGNCYGCGGRMYASGGQFVPGRGFVLSEDNSDNLLGAGIVGGLKGATAMIPGVGGYVSQGIDAIYKGIDPTLSDAEKRAMGYTQGVTSLSGLVTGNVPGAISNSIAGFNQGIQNTEGISDETKNILGGVGTITNAMTPFLGRPGMPLGKNTPINVIDETDYIDLPDTFAMGGTMGKGLSAYYDADGMGGYLGTRNFFSNGGDMNPPNKYLVRTNQNGDLIEETYKIGDVQFNNVRKITEPTLSEMDVLQKYEEVTGKNLNATKPSEPAAQPENVPTGILPFKQKISESKENYPGEAYEKLMKILGLNLPNTPTISTQNNTTTEDFSPTGYFTRFIDLPDDLDAPVATPTPTVNTNKPNMIPVEGIDGSNSILTAFMPDSVPDSEIPELNTGEDLTEEQKQTARENYARKQALDMAKINLKYKESLPAFALSMAPSMYNLYQGLSRPDQMNLNDIYSGDINPELVNYATSRNIMRDTAAGLKKDIKSKTQGGAYLANIQSTANKLSEGLSKIDELEQNTNAKIKSETDSLNKKRKDEALKVVTQYNKMAKAAKAAHLNEALSGLKSKIETDAKNKFDLEKLKIFAPDVAGNLEYNTILDQLGSYTAGLFNKKKKI
jgi:hypothetical protein